MRKITTALAIIAVLFAAGAIVIAFGSTVLLKNQTQSVLEGLPSEQELLDQARVELENEHLDEEEEEASTVPQTLDQLTDIATLGITFDAPGAWGDFVLNCTTGIASLGEGRCEGSFADMPGLTMRAIAPLTDPLLGAHGAHLVDYRETQDGYYVLTDQGWEAPVPSNLVNGELETVTGAVLVLNSDTEELSLFPSTGTRSALQPVNNPYLRVIMWSADDTVSRDAFRVFLQSLEVTTPDLEELLGEDF